MDLRQLDYFVHVAELGSFTKAAALLSVAQSAMSHQVRQLEVELKQSLLYRNGRGVTPTDAGKRLLDHARGILMQVNRARDELAETRGAPVGHTVLGLPASIAKILTVPLVRSFRGSFPNASLGIVEALSAAVIELLVTGRVDVGLVFNPLPSLPIEIIPVRLLDMFLVGPKTDKQLQHMKSVQARDLPHYPLILPSRVNANRMRLDAQLAELGLRPQVIFEIDGSNSVLDLVNEGYGYTVLPLSTLRGHNVSGNFVTRPIVNPKVTIQLSLVISAQRPTTTLTRGVLDLVRSVTTEVLFGDSAGLALLARKPPLETRPEALDRTLERARAFSLRSSGSA